MRKRTRLRVLLVIVLTVGFSIALTACASSRSGTLSAESDSPESAELNERTGASEVEEPTVTEPTEPPPSTATAIATVAVPTSTPTPAPTLTPTPTATPVPTLDQYDVAALYGVDTGALVSGCPNVHDLRNAYPPRLSTVCDIAERAGAAGAPAAGYIVALSRRSAQTATSTAPRTHPTWAWSDTAAMGEHVVIDHGARAGHGNVTTVIWGLDLDEDLFIGQQVDTGFRLGDASASVSMQVWLGESVFGDVVALDPLPFDDVHQIASGLAPLMAAPVAPECTVNFGAASQLPNAGRPYRSGTHRGVDLICGTTGHSAFAALDGTVVAVTNDYVDAPVQNRLNILTNASIAGGTPQWTLNLLFGNYVVIEHVDPDGREVVTISAHLESVDPHITVGAVVGAGDRVGEIGNRGTGPSAAGTTPVWDSSRHLHWEFFVDGRYLGEGLSPAETATVYRTLLCGSAAMTGCV